MYINLYSSHLESLPKENALFHHHGTKHTDVNRIIRTMSVFIQKRAHSMRVAYTSPCSTLFQVASIVRSRHHLHFHIFCIVCIVNMLQYTVGILI